MLSLNNLFVKYGDRIVLDSLSATAQHNDRIGLVGVNGAGKSTLMKIVARELSPHGGNVVMHKHATIGYLHQDMNLPKDKTVLEETLTAFSEAKDLERQLEELNQELAQREDYETDSYALLLEDITELNERLLVLGGDNLRVEAEKILMGLGFTVADFDRPTAQLSGGWQMRVELAKMLLRRPSFLLLDEPTNHLDIESILWLESFLKNYSGCVILISHDRTFLDNVTRRTWEIELGKLYDYKAPYSRYLELRSERQEQLRNAYENQQKEIARKERLIDRFRAKANKASMAKSLIKELDRMDKIEMEEGNDAVMRLQFPPAPRSGEVVVDVKGLVKRYGEKTVLDGIDLQIVRGERVSFVGKNGEGKSTLVKILVGDVPADAGHAALGYNVALGYYAQNQSEVLDPQLTVYQTIEQVSPPEMRTRLRAILGSFLFSGEDIDKKVLVLSGGERARLAMACLLLRPINLLVLDEPTNHLDMRSKEVLKEALLRYDGTLIVVSHDRDFLTGLTDKTLEFRSKSVKPYLGDIRYFLEKRALDSMRDVSLGKNLEPNPTANNQRMDRSDDKAYQQELKNLKKKVQDAEKRISRLESDLKNLETQLADMSIFGSQRYQDLTAKHKQTQTDLEQAMLDWEQAEEELAKLMVNG